MFDGGLWPALRNMILRPREVALVALRQHMKFPRPPECPFRVAGVARVGLAHNDVIVVAVVIKTLAVDEVLDPALVHKGIVAEVSAVVDHVVAYRER